MAFDWRSRLTWIGRTDSGVVRQRLYDRNIHGLGLSVIDPGAPKWAAAIRGETGFPFWYSDPHWFGLAGDGSALKYRQLLDAQLAALALPDEMLMVDLEFVSQEYVRRLLNGSSGNRGLVGSNNPSFPTGTQAGRPISYSNMPFQNHTVVPFQTIWDAGLHWYPQGYYGDMSPADLTACTLEILRDMRAWALDPADPEAGGFPVNYCDFVHPFYDGKLIATDQRDGAYFTAERIPGVFSAQSLVKFATNGEAAMSKTSLRLHYSLLAKAA